MKNNRAMSVATFLYQQIYCRYMSPGECIIYDRGEFCNKIVDILNTHFQVQVRVISAGRPQANGQVESFIGSLKNKMYALMVERGSHLLPDTWDETLLHTALQILRSDPSIATGYSPIELLLGRKPIFPIQLQYEDVDLSGTDLTAPLVDALSRIHNNAFGVACKKIKKAQERYAKAYLEFQNNNPPKFSRKHS